MSQAALAMWCTWYISWSCIFYISEWAAADLPFDNVQLAVSALGLAIVILHLPVQPSHSLQSQRAPLCERSWDYGPANFTKLCLLQMQILPAAPILVQESGHEGLRVEHPSPHPAGHSGATWTQPPSPDKLKYNSSPCRWSHSRRFNYSEMRSLHPKASPAIVYTFSQ